MLEEQAGAQRIERHRKSHDQRHDEGAGNELPQRFVENLRIPEEGDSGDGKQSQEGTEHPPLTDPQEHVLQAQRRRSDEHER